MVALVSPARFGNALGADVQEEYRGRFERWGDRSSVRVKPAPVLQDGDGEYFFSPELVPAAAHPLVAGLGDDAVRRLLVHRLYDYLTFTVVLEQVAVMPVSTLMSQGRLGVALPAGLRADAFKITTDEAWHAQFSFDLMDQVARRTGVPVRLPERPAFLRGLAEIGARVDPDLRGLDEVVFTIVSETLISALLSDLPKDVRLPAAVRESVADHAADEGRHHACFADLLTRVWPALSRDQRRRMGPWVPAFVRTFLEPDRRALAFALHEVGLPPDGIDQVLAEAYPDDAVRRAVADGARATVRHFARAGALDEPGTREAFLASGLIDERYPL
ncbi:diiron oxygenase [Actinomadura rupiterrae]|uniref:diiron oxygenase n=1 Tax=Actinomadura rupiterrae TaxID=559627 RepID=UPI0020A5BD1D|nr:diiron oxygenase [Actinomadura rupiterrae]MCP2336338.1 hypothetical protein [Actinomadura rupiterrae]